MSPAWITDGGLPIPTWKRSRRKRPCSSGSPGADRSPPCSTRRVADRRFRKFILGVILGPGLGGWLSLPFFVGAGLSLIAPVFVALLLPESLPPEARGAAQRKVGPGDFAALWRAARGPLGGLLLLACLGTVGTFNFEAIFRLYAAQKLGYGPEQVGLILTVVGIVAVIGRGLLTGLATERWGEPRVIQAALLAGALAPNAREGGQIIWLQVLSLMPTMMFIPELIEGPNGPLTLFLSLFPFSAPSAMVTRLAAGEVPLWQIGLSVAGLALTASLFIDWAARSFRADTLLSFASFNWRRLLTDWRS